MPVKQLNFEHKRSAKPEVHIDHVAKAWSDIQFERYINQNYFEKLRAMERGTYNNHRALKSA